MVLSLGLGAPGVSKMTLCPKIMWISLTLPLIFVYQLFMVLIGYAFGMLLSNISVTLSLGLMALKLGFWAPRPFKNIPLSPKMQMTN